MSGRNRRASASAAVAVAGVADLVAAELEHLAADLADRRIVVDDQHARRLAPAGSRRGAGTHRGTAPAGSGTRADSSAPAASRSVAALGARRRTITAVLRVSGSCSRIASSASASSIAPATTARAGCSARAIASALSTSCATSTRSVERHQQALEQQRAARIVVDDERARRSRRGLAPRGRRAGSIAMAGSSCSASPRPAA